MFDSAPAAKRAMLVVVIFSLAGCEVIAGLQRRSLGASADAGDAATAIADFSACKLSGSGKGLLRLGNLVPSTTRVDVCLKPSTTTSFASVQPLFGGAGGACSAGLEYKAVTTTIATEPGTYDVKFVTAGATSCDGEEVASLSQVLVKDRPATAVYLIGNGKEAPVARRYVESPGTENISSTFRLLVTTSDFGSVDLGFIVKDTQPPALDNKFLSKLSFGDPAPGAATTNIPSTADGYVNWSSAGGRWHVAAASTTDGTILADTYRKLDGAASYTFFLTGRNDGHDFPLEVFGCDETKSTGMLANCGDSRPLDFVADVLNVDLGGAFVPAEPARRPAIVDAVAKLDSDALCILEAYSDADKDAIIEAAKGAFPYSYYEKTTWDTQPTDPHTLAGTDPLPITGPACSASEAKMNTAIDCLRDQCTDSPGSDDATIRHYPATCMSDKCTGALAGLIVGEKKASGVPSDAGCWGCVFSQLLSYEKMGDIRKTCMTNAKAEFAFRGQAAPLILSRHPISQPEAFVLPGAPWRTVALRAPVTLDNGAKVDFYCATATTVVSDCVFFPIPSRWASASATDCQTSGREEQRLELTQLRNFVDSRSTATSTKAILAASPYAGPAYQDVIAAQELDNFNTLASSFALGVPPAYEPQCTNCGDNPIRTMAGETSSLPSYWSSFHLLKNIPVTAVRRSEVILKDATVASTSGDGAQSERIPLSRHYGFRSVIRLSP